jgi:hypothetical protein
MKRIYTKVVVDIETLKQLEAESFSYGGEVASCGPASSILGGAGGGMLGGLGTVLSTASAANDLFGPKGAMVTGDISKGASAAQNLYSGGKGIFGSDIPMPEKFGPPTTMTTMGMSRDQFMGLDPKVREKLLRQLAEETNVLGSIR